MKKIKAILFDMDGVLIDAKEWHYEALNKALEGFGLTISRYDHQHTYDGLPTLKKLEILSRKNGLPLDLHASINQLKQKYTMELINQRCKPYPPHQHALSYLKEQGYKIAVCSNSIRHTIDIMMERSDLKKYIDLILSVEDVKHAKPDSEIYTLAVKHLNLTPSECLIVEDNPHGIEAARKSGCHVLEVASIHEVNLENIIKAISYHQVAAS